MTMNDHECRRCPNCGAPRRGDTCEYCETVFFDESPWDNPQVAKIRHDTRLDSLDIIYTDQGPYAAVERDGSWRILTEEEKWQYRKEYQ